MCPEKKAFFAKIDAAAGDNYFGIPPTPREDTPPEQAHVRPNSIGEVVIPDHIILSVN